MDHSLSLALSDTPASYFRACIWWLGDIVAIRWLDVDIRRLGCGYTL